MMLCRTAPCLAPDAKAGLCGSEHLWWREDCGRWHVLQREGGCTCNGRDPHIRPLTPADPLFRLEWWADGDTLTFCDCPPGDDPVATEAENRAGD